MPLLRRRKLDSAVKNAYWLVVRDCLIDLFGVAAGDAAFLSSDFRTKLESAPKSARDDITYHEDPFLVAESLSRRPGLSTKVPPPNIDDPAILNAYESIMARHGLV
jgi:hypothetical protein